MANLTFDGAWATLPDGATVDATLKHTLPGDHPTPAEQPPPDGRPVPSLPHLTIGDVVPGEPFGPELRRRTVLGQGGMGIVYEAHQTSLDRDVAIKQLRPGAPRGSHAALMQEARTMGRLDHPNVVPVHALGVDDEGAPALVMKRVEGVPWRTLIHRPDHPWWAADGATDPLRRHLGILADLCQAVHYAHSRGVLHRDLKPDNVMLGSFGEVFLMDWGIATALDAPDRRGIVGTPAYMAPEMLDLRAPLSPATDVFLLGACLREILTGAPPYAGDDLQAVMRAASACDPSSWPPEVDPELAAICDRACSRDPAERFATAAELRRALLNVLEHRDALAVAEVARERLATLLTLPSDPAGSGTDSERAEELFVECRFGFRQALAAFPDSPHAVAGLRDAYAAMAQLRLSRGDLGGAESLVADLAELAPDAAAPLRESLEAARLGRASLERLARDLDPAVGNALRMRLGLVVLGVSTLLTLYITTSVDSGDVGHAFTIRASGALLIATSVATTALWPRIRDSAVSRACAAALLTAFGGLFAHRLLAWHQGTPVPDVLAVDLLILALCTALLVRPGIPWTVGLSALPLLGGAALAALRPDWAIPTFNGTTIAAVVIAVIALWRARGR